MAAESTFELKFACIAAVMTEFKYGGRVSFILFSRYYKNDDIVLFWC
jgi:hypothetical protein